MIELSYDPESPELPSEKILDSMCVAARAVAARYGVDCAEASLLFAPPDLMKKLNREHRGLDEVTDVLSFPQSDGGAPQGAARPGECPLPSGECPLLLGDIVICAERASEQARDYGHGDEREFVYLFTHGLLHLLGYDHGSDEARAAMRSAEEDVMREAGL